MNKELKNYIISILILIAFFIILLIRFPLLPVLYQTPLENILTSNDIINNFIGLVIGLFSSVIFSFFKEYIPENKRQQNTIRTLNTLIASVIDTYNQVKMFGHETSIKHVNIKDLNKDFLNDEINKLKKYDIGFMKLKYAMQTAYTKHDDFKHSLMFTSILDSTLQMEWLNIVEKVRLLAESYGQQPNVTEKEVATVDQNDKSNLLFVYKQTLCLRTMEYFEGAIDWLNTLDKLYKYN